MSEFIQEEVERYVSSLLPSLGLELVEVQFRREGNGWVLRIYIDCEDGVTLDHCTEVSRDLSGYLDVEDLIDHPYNLEVSSPGIERPLKKLADFRRFAGRKAKVKLSEPVDGQKVFIGDILPARDGENETIELELEGGGSVRFMFEKINKARLSL